jgi:uracil-xanthine permease
MYANGFCPSDESGMPLPCPQGYGAILGTSAVCALLEIGISFLPPKVLLRMFPPIVTGPTVMLIGIKLIQSGFKNWMGGTGLCASPATATGIFELCPNINSPHALPWGSPEYLGLGFSVFITIILCERFGSPIMKSTSVVIGLLVGCIIAAATGYFDRSTIDIAPAASFIWVETFPLSIYPPLVLPILAVFIIVATEAIGDITATCDVSRLEVTGPIYESRIQGGVLGDGLIGLLAALMTITPMSTFAQNNGVIALTRCANRKAGYACCIFLIIMGVFAKFAASLVAIPAPVLGGMTTFLFCAVAVSGMAIISRPADAFSRRSRFILTAGLSLGYGATLVPTYFDNIFSYSGDNKSLQGFLDAITLIMETGFAVTAFVCCILNLILPLEMEEDIDASDNESVNHKASTAVTGKADEEHQRTQSDEIHPVSGSGIQAADREKQV